MRHDRRAQSPVHTRNPVVRQHPLNRGLLSWWLCLPHTAGGRQLYDLVGMRRGTLGSVFTWGGSTRPGGFGHVTGTNGISASDTLNAIGAGDSTFTVSFWVTNGDFVKWAQNVRGFRVYANATSAIAQYTAPSTALSATVSLTGFTQHGSWRHMTFVCTTSTTVADANSVTVYCNGRLAGSATGTGVYVPPTAADTPKLNQFISGSIDDVRVWDRGLSAAEVRAVYEESLRGHPETIRRVPRRVQVQAGFARPPVAVPRISRGRGRRHAPIYARAPVAREHPLNRDLLLWWLGLPHNAGGRTVYDLLGLRHGALQGTQAVWQGSRARPGGFAPLTMSGTGTQGVTATVPSATFADSSWTVAGWFRMAFLSGMCPCAFNYGNAGTVGWSTITAGTSGAIQFRLHGTSIALNFTGGYPDSQWVHLAAVATTSTTTPSGNTLRLYRNGVDAGTNGTVTGTYTPGALDGLRLGSRAGDGLSQTNGSFDDFRIWTRALSAAEVRAAYDDSAVGHLATLCRYTRRLGVYTPPTFNPAWLSRSPVLGSGRI